DQHEQSIVEIFVRAFAVVERIGEKMKQRCSKCFDALRLHWRTRFHESYRVAAPCANHVTINARSASVICVRLPIGMYLLLTVSATLGALAAIWSGVSSTMPFGGCANPVAAVFVLVFAVASGAVLIVRA